MLHKFEQIGFGQEIVYVKQCVSIRMAHTTQLQQSDRPPRELSHVYCAMGLNKQHHFQQVVLGRFKNLTIAGYFVAAASAVLQIDFREELVSVLETMSQSNREKARQQFCRACCDGGALLPTTVGYEALDFDKLFGKQLSHVGAVLDV